MHESESGTRLPIWNVQIESVGLGLMRRDHGLVGRLGDHKPMLHQFVGDTQLTKRWLLA